MSLHSQHYSRSSGSDKVGKVMVCVCVHTSRVDWLREGWTGEAIV